MKNDKAGASRLGVEQRPLWGALWASVWLPPAASPAPWKGKGSFISHLLSPTCFSRWWAWCLGQTGSGFVVAPSVCVPQGSSNRGSKRSHVPNHCIFLERARYNHILSHCWEADSAQFFTGTLGGKWKSDACVLQELLTSLPWAALSPKFASSGSWWKDTPYSAAKATSRSSLLGEKARAWKQRGSLTQRAALQHRSRELLRSQGWGRSGRWPRTLSNDRAPQSPPIGLGASSHQMQLLAFTCVGRNESNCHKSQESLVVKEWGSQQDWVWTSAP